MQAEVRWSETEGRKHGWAHVQFADVSAVEQALAMSGQSFQGRDLVVSRANPLRESGGAGAPLNLGKAVKDCWFCLSNEEADVHLVVDVLDGAYLALDKGPINDTHCLLVCVEHFPNTLTLSTDQQLSDFEKIIKSLSAAFASRQLRLIGFERCVGNLHVPYT